MMHRRDTGAMNTIGPIALAQSTDLVRRAVRGSGPDGGDAVPAVPERPRSRWTLLRLRRHRGSGVAGHPAAGNTRRDRISASPRPPSSRRPARA